MAWVIADNRRIYVLIQDSFNFAALSFLVAACYT